MEIKYFPLTEVWKNDFEIKRKKAKELVENITGKKIKSEVGDLEILQTVLDLNIINEKDVITFQSFGVLFGDAIAKEINSEWCMISDEFGVDPTLKIFNKQANVNALTIISKRIEEKREINLFEIFQGVKEYLRTNKFAEG